MDSESLIPVEPLPAETHTGILTMRDYQVSCVQGIYEQLSAHRSTLAVLATGLGKTIIAAEVAALWPPDRGRVLFLAHRRELIEQAAASIGLHINDGCGIEMGQQSEARNQDGWCGGGKVLVGSVQTLSRPRRIEPYNPADFGLIITDEAHHATAGTYRRIYGHFQQNRQCRFLGITATPDRADEAKLGEVFESVAFKMDILDGIEKGWLVPIRQKFVRVEGLDFGACRTTAGDLNERDLERAMAGANADELGEDGSHLTAENLAARQKQEHMLHAVADPTIKEANGRPGIVFCVTVDHAEKMAQVFRRYDVTAECVTQNTPHDLRGEHIKAFKAGRLQFLIGVGVFTEGFDAPNAAVIAVARPTKSRALYCLDAKTEALTQRGWVNGCDLIASDVIAGFDVTTSEITWQAIQDHIVRPILSTEYMVSASGPSVDVRMTNTHRTVFRQRVGRARSRTAWKVECGDSVSRKRRVELPVCGIQKSPGVPLTDDEIRFVGLVVTDGNFNPHNNQISLYQSENSTVFEVFERTLVGCGLKFGKHRCEAPSNLSERRSAAIRWTISKGIPRGRDKHLRGWEKLERFIPKVSGSWDAWESATPEQWSILLNAMHCGDGSKQLNKEWTRRSYHIAIKRSDWADTIQSLSVRKGWRCSLATHHNGEDRSINILHLKQVDSVSVNTNRTGRTQLQRCDFSLNELVWCVSVASGAFVCRRNGKVLITGNTQMVGRATRPIPDAINGREAADERRAGIAASDKPTATVLDFIGNSGRHKLVSTADILGDAYPADLREQVVREMQGADAENMLDALEAAQKRREHLERLKAEKEAEERRLRAQRQKEMLERVAEERRLRELRAKAKYSARDVDPFGDFAPHQDGQVRTGPSEKQIALLVALGVKRETAESYTPSQAGAVIGRYRQRKGGEYVITFGNRWIGRTLKDAGEGFIYFVENVMRDSPLRQEVRRNIDLMRREQVEQMPF